MADIKITFGDFSDTTFRAEALSDAGKNFLFELGGGPVTSIDFLKSYGMVLETKIIEYGLVIE